MQNFHESDTLNISITTIMLQVEMNINNMTIRMPHQLFINGEFVEAEGGKTYKTINPTTAEVVWRCSVGY